MRNILTIANREYKAYFSSFTVYLFAAVIFLVIGVFFAGGLIYSMGSFGQAPPPGLDYVLGPLIILLWFACPAFTMRLLSEEQRLGTMELLLTAPVRDIELVIGKWLGSFMLVLTLVGVTLVYPVVIHLISDPGIDLGVMVSGYLGVLLVTSVFLGLGVAVSSLFSNQIASYITSFGIIVAFWWLFDFLGQIDLIGGSAVFQFLSLGRHFYDYFMAGVIHLSSVVYYVTFTALTLVIGAVSVEARRWR
jgi:ABC-2 type transport system permease protein